MTVIAFDGRYVAADRMAENNGTAMTVRKLRVHGPQVLAFNGTADHGSMLMQWFVEGRDPKTFPTVPDPKYAAYLDVFERGKPVMHFELFPVAMFFEDPIYAAGSGRDLALGAMAMGAPAKEAVEIASRFDVNCGMGVDVIDLWELGDAQHSGDRASSGTVPGRAPAAVGV